MGNPPSARGTTPPPPVNLCRELVAYELKRRLFTKEERRLAPLLLNPSGTCWRKQPLADFFKLLCLKIMSAEEAAKLSVHSFRIYLACALRDQGVPPDTIKEVLRWASDQALALYARANVAADAAVRASAANSTVDSVRMTTVLAAPDGRSTPHTQSLTPPRPAAPSAFRHDSDHSQREQMVAGALARTALNLDAPVPDVDPELSVFAAIHNAAAALERQARQSSMVDDASTDDDSDAEP